MQETSSFALVEFRFCGYVGKSYVLEISVV